MVPSSFHCQAGSPDTQTPGKLTGPPRPGITQYLLGAALRRTAITEHWLHQHGGKYRRNKVKTKSKLTTYKLEYNN